MISRSRLLSVFLCCLFSAGTYAASSAFGETSVAPDSPSAVNTDAEVQGKASVTPSVTTTTTTSPPPTTTTTPVMEQPPANGKIVLVPQSVNGKNESVLSGDRWKVVGTVTPYVEDQKVQVSVAVDKRIIQRYSLRIRHGKNGLGTFTIRIRFKRVGHVVVRVTHPGTDRLAAIKAKPVTVDILPNGLRRGQRGRKVELVQRHLRAMGYVTGRKGFFDARMGRAAMAFRKMTEIARNESIDKGFLRRLVQGKGRFRVRFPKQGRHVEASISRQVLALIVGGRVERIYPVSSGAPATPTIRGSFQIYQKSYGTNKKGMVHSSYFRGGYAIHGYASVPPYPASHGCLRVPVPDALPIYNWVSYGMWVDVYL